MRLSLVLSHRVKLQSELRHAIARDHVRAELGDHSRVGNAMQCLLLFAVLLALSLGRVTQAHTDMLCSTLDTAVSKSGL